LLGDEMPVIDYEGAGLEQLVVHVREQVRDDSWPIRPMASSLLKHALCPLAKAGMKASDSFN
jgi:hypothetical protein